jgi:pimeloyl-ACP methyl ester carboxylesterase
MKNTSNWILLRGLARGAGHWGNFFNKIRAQFPQDQFELLDLPGNGSRYNDLSPLNISEYVPLLRDKSKFIQQGLKVKILSISLGSMVAVEWMKTYPLEVEKAYLLCTSSRGLSSFHERLKMSNLLKVPQLILSRKDAVFYENTILEMVGNSFDRRNEELPKLADYSRQHPVHPKNVVRQLWAASHYDFPPKPPGEVVLIGSYGDRLVSPKCTLDIASRWGLSPVMHPWAGHEIPLDDPDWVIDKLAKF